jgi:hypothetical protein
MVLNTAIKSLMILFVIRIVEFLGFVYCPVFFKLLKHNISGTGSIPNLRCGTRGIYSVGSVRNC